MPAIFLFLQVGARLTGLRKRSSMITSKHGSVVLCVDDEAVGLSIRKLILETQGYRVFTAENGPKALELFSAEPIDIVVLDYKMPGMNGDVVAEGMRALKPAIPILMLSAYLDLPLETLALVEKSLTKGGGPEVLLQAIEELLAQAGGQSKATSVK